MYGESDLGDRHGVAVAGVVLLGAILRLYELGTESLWVDEIITLRFIRNYSPGELLWVIPAKQPHLPLYYMVLDAWTALAGTAEPALRFPSAVFGILCLPLLYLVGRRLFDRQTGLVATLLLAISPFHLYYAQETRMYSLLTAATLVSFLFLLRLRETASRANVAGYITGTVVTLAVHPFGFLVLVAQSLALGIEYVRADEHHRQQRLTHVTKVNMACCGMLVPILVIGAKKASGAVSGFVFISPPNLMDVVWTVHEYFTTTAGPDTMAVAILGGVAVGLAFLRRRLDSERVLLLSWMLVPVLTLVAVSYLVTPLFWDRYTIAASPAWFLAVALGITGLERRHARYALAGLLIVAMGPGVVAYHTTPQKEEWEPAATYIDRHSQPDDVVLIMDDGGKQAFDHYWSNPKVPVQGVPAGHTPDGEPLTTEAALHRRVNGSDRVWLVFTHIWFYPGEKQRALAALNDTRTIERHRDYFGIELFLLDESCSSC